MLKLVLMPPQNDLQRQWAPRLQHSLPDYHVVVPETEAEARHELIDADAAYGWVPPDVLPAASRLCRFQVLYDNARRFAAGEPLRNVVDNAAWY
jgi:hypothetical protein